MGAGSLSRLGPSSPWQSAACASNNARSSTSGNGIHERKKAVDAKCYNENKTISGDRADVADLSICACGRKKKLRAAKNYREWIVGSIIFDNEMQHDGFICKLLNSNIRSVLLE